MPEANVNDPVTVEGLYPRDAFQRDARSNSDAKATVHHGVLILSGVDSAGTFRAERASRQVGESDPEGDTVFVAPFLAELAPVGESGTYGAPGASGEAAANSTDAAGDYRAFIVRILETARSAEFKPPIGRNEGRLQGFHGG
jgi:hypothetical protein